MLPADESSKIALTKTGTDANGITSLMKASKNGDIKTVKALLTTKSDINAKDKYEWTALIYAFAKGNTEIVKALIQAGADFNARDKTREYAFKLRYPNKIIM